LSDYSDCPEEALKSDKSDESQFGQYAPETKTPDALLYKAKAENDRRKTGRGLGRFLQSEGAVRVNE